MEEVLTMAQWEVDRLHVIRKVLSNEMSWGQAAQQLDLSVRQVGRICARVRSRGAKGIIHGLRGKTSNRGFEAKRMRQALAILRDPLWEGFGPTFARDKLAALHGITVGRETLRRWMMRDGLWKAWRGPKKHRAWRERRPCVGMLIQLDGSEHAWFEERASKCVLIAYIDDATGRILHAEFAESEDTLTLMRTTRAYLSRHGRPVAFYVDKDSIYKVNKTKQQAKDPTFVEPVTQFKRAMDELGIEVIWAHSPQAKGRIERSFKTHQDRLVKELRLAGISDMGSGNTFLRERYIPEHNERYSIAPAQPTDVHRPLLKTQCLDKILSLRHQRTVQNDFTVQWGGDFFQLLSDRNSRIRPKDEVELETRLDGSLHVRHQERYLSFKTLKARPHRPAYASFPTRKEAKRTKLTTTRKRTPGSGRWLFYGKAPRSSGYYDWQT